MTTIMQPFQCDLQPKIQETHRTTHTGTTTRCRTQRRNQFAHETTAAAPVAQTRYLASPAAATLHGKTQGFVLRLPPQNKAHATFMQPYNTVRSITWLTRISLRTWQHQSMTTIMQPFQCDLQAKIQETHRTTHTGTTTRCRTQRRNQFAHETTAAVPVAHKRYLSSPTAATLHGKIQGFVLRLPPKTKPMQHSCSHYNTFHSITWLTRISLRTWQQSMTTIMQPFQCDL